MRTAAFNLMLATLFWVAQPVHALHWQLQPGPNRAAANPEAGHAHGHDRPPQSNAAPQSQPVTRGRYGTVPRLSETEGVEVALWSPEPQRIELGGEQPRLPRMAPGYYQALVALRRHEGGEDSAVHYLRLRSPESRICEAGFRFGPRTGSALPI